MSEDEVNLLGLVSERDIVHALGVYGARTLDLRASDIMTLVIYAAAGVGFGMRISLLTTIPADLFDRSFGAILGFTNGGGGLGGFIGPFLAGYLFDHIGDYQLAFTVSALAIAGSAVAVGVAGPRTPRPSGNPWRTERVPSGPSPPPLYRWVCLGVLFLGASLSFCVRLAPAAALPDLQAAFGLTAVELSLLTAVYLWPFAVMQPVAGLLTDTLGPRRSVTIFLIIAGLGQLLLALAPNFALALTGRACTGIGTSFLHVAAARIMAQWFRRREFGTLTGAWTSVANLGGIVAAAPPAAPLPVIGWRASFAAIGVAVLFAALLVFLVVRNSPTDWLARPHRP